MLNLLRFRATADYSATPELAGVQKPRMTKMWSPSSGSLVMAAASSGMSLAKMLCG